MKTPNAPSPEKVFDELAWLLPEIYRALDIGTFEAKSHFDSKEIKRSNHQAGYSHLVRIHAKEYLQKMNIDAVDIEQLNLSGLSLKLEQYSMKIWKECTRTESGVPRPGSEKQEDFCQQTMFESDGPVKLIVLWNIDPLGNLHELKLACPKDTDNPENVECHWVKPISDPTLSIQPLHVVEVHEDFQLEELSNENEESESEGDETREDKKRK